MGTQSSLQAVAPDVASFIQVVGCFLHLLKDENQCGLQLPLPATAGADPDYQKEIKMKTGQNDQIHNHPP